MTMQATDRKLTFNPFSQEHGDDPESSFGPLREVDPVHCWEGGGGAWVMTRYRDVAELLKDPRFTMDQRVWKNYVEPEAMKMPDLIAMRESHLFQIPPDRHARVRKIAAPTFAPSRIAGLEGKIQELVDQIFVEARADERDTLDISRDLAGPLPIRAIAAVLGIPTEHQEVFRRWGASLLKIVLPFYSADELREAAEIVPIGCNLIRELIEERRVRPREDLLGVLVSAHDEGQRLTSDELLSLVASLITAGSDSTAFMISFAVYNLLKHPDQLAIVRDDPTKIPGALEEALRFDNFSRLGTLRFALEDVTVHGKTIRRGDMVVAAIGGAMHDREVWPDAERFDVTRDPTRNLSWGRGPHYCPGMHLARLEGMVAVRTLLQRYPSLRLVREPTIAPHPMLRPMPSLEVSIRPE